MDTPSVSGPVFRHEAEKVEYRWLETPTSATKSYAAYLIESSLLQTVYSIYFANFEDQVIKIEEMRPGQGALDPDDFDPAFIVMWQMLFSRHVDNAICYFKDIIREMVELDKKILGKIIGFNFIDQYEKGNQEKRLYLIRRATKKMSITNLDDFPNIAQTAFGFNPFPLEDQLLFLRSHIQVRDMIVHNRGIADFQFRRYQELRKRHVGPAFPLGVRYVTPPFMRVEFDLGVAVGLFDKVLTKKYNVGQFASGPRNG